MKIGICYRVPKNQNSWILSLETVCSQRRWIAFALCNICHVNNELPFVLHSVFEVASVHSSFSLKEFTHETWWERTTKDVSEICESGEKETKNDKPFHTHWTMSTRAVDITYIRFTHDHSTVVSNRPGTTAEVFSSRYCDAVVIVKRLYIFFFPFSICCVPFVLRQQQKLTKELCTLVWATSLNFSQHIGPMCNWCGCDISTMGREKNPDIRFPVFFSFVCMFILFPLEFAVFFFFSFTFLFCICCMCVACYRIYWNDFHTVAPISMQLMPKKR